jgi:heme/copper-type cytochrome/quinol oxidase subunit 2
MILLVLGTVLGMPTARIMEQDKTKLGFDTTIVIKYIFFFIGLYFVYLSLGMSRRMSTTYGSESTITGATDTAAMVMTITLGLFIFIFVLEFLFTTLKMFKEAAEQKKWGQREEE